MSDSIPKPQRKHWYKRWWIWMLAVLVIGVAGGSAVGKQVIDAQRLASYDYLKETVRAETRDIRKTISTTGTIVPDAQVQLAPQGSGTVTEVNVSVGQDVVKGDVLVVIDPDLPGVSKNIEATFDGRVVSLATFVGDRVSAVQPVVAVAYRTNHIEFYASDSEAIDLHTGQAVEVSVPSYENGKTVYNAEVSFVDVKKTVVSAVTASANSGFLVKVSTGNIPAQVTSVIGLTVDLTITTKEKTAVLSVENAAIQYNDDGTTFVYLPIIVDQAFANRASTVENVATILEKKSVAIDFESDTYTEITDGLNAGDTVMFYVPSQGSSSPF